METQKNEVIYDEKDPCDCLYVIKEGEFEVNYLKFSLKKFKLLLLFVLNDLILSSNFFVSCNPILYLKGYNFSLYGYLDNKFSNILKKTASKISLGIFEMKFF